MGSDKRAKQVARARKLFSDAPFGGELESSEVVNSYEAIFANQIEKTAAAVEITRNNPSFMMQHMAGKVQMMDMFDTNGVASIHCKTPCVHSFIRTRARIPRWFCTHHRAHTHTRLYPWHTNPTYTYTSRALASQSPLYPSLRAFSSSFYS